jgi:hypothetical protein
VRNDDFVWDSDLDAKDNLCGILGICGCGISDDVLRLFQRELTRLDSRDLQRHGRNYEDELRKVYGRGVECLDDPLVWAFIYNCDSRGLTEHGASAWCGWLTPKGEKTLDKLNAYLATPRRGDGNRRPGGGG